MIATIEEAIAPVPTTATADNPIAELRKTISPSRLNCWLTCRLKFWFRYVQQIPKPPTPSLHVGSVVHAVLQAWNKARWRKQPFVTEQFKNLFHQQWKALQDGVKINWGKEEPDEQTGAWALLKTYFLETPIKVDEKPEAVEVLIEAGLSAHGLPTLIGVIDLVRAGGRIVDFKTAGQTPCAEKVAHLHEVQLSCYSLLYREATGRVESGLELHHLIKLKKPKVTITTLKPTTAQQHLRLFKIIESYVQSLDRQDFIPAAGFHCSCCEYFHECRQ